MERPVADTMPAVTLFSNVNGEPIASTNIFGIPYLADPSTTTIARLDRHGELPALEQLVRCTA